VSSERERLLLELSDAVRRSQRATDTVDEAASQLLGINRTDSRCLDILEQRGRMTAGELAREARLSTGAITAVLDRLEHAGYVRRIDDPADRRRVLVEVTDATRTASGELFGPMAQAAGALLERYSDRQLRLLIEFHRLGAELQERHAQWLHERGPATAR
jgi:DNA-binding MarR family transcriptional regulator